MNELRNDKNLQEAVSRREQKLPPLPADLNERLMQRLVEPETAPAAKPRRLWLYAAVASIALLIIFHFGKEQTSQEPIVAQQTVKQLAPQPVSEISEPVEEPAPVVAEAQPAQKSVKKQRKVVMQLVELIPTSEEKSDNVKELPASLIDTDPLVAMAAQVENIRQRGQRLQQEIEERIGELKN